MQRIERSMEIEAPRDVVYEQLRNVEVWPRFMSWLVRVERSSGDRLLFVTRNAEGREAELPGEILADIPPERFTWIAGEGDGRWGTTVVVTDGGEGRTRVDIAADVQGSGAHTVTDDDLARLEGDLGRFRDLIEGRRPNDADGIGLDAIVRDQAHRSPEAPLANVPDGD
jgi:uncharacterized membrane protein